MARDSTTQTGASADADAERRDARTARRLLVLLSALYLAFLFFHVPRLNNYVHSDREFTGWVGPVAERLARGERLYVDFVLPIPPGSFALLALIQRIAGRPRLLQELWVAGLSHYFMGLIAYAIAARFSTRKVGLLVAITTLVLVTQSPKECVYDHTSLLVAWLSVLAGTHAALAPQGPGRARLWLATGLLATFSLGFKQSTAVGMIVGWTLGLAYLVGMEARRGRRAGARARLADAAAWALGGAIGLALVALLLVSVRASIPGFVQSVLRDGPSLKGGTFALLRNLVTFTTQNDAIRNTIVPTGLVLGVGFAVARRHGHLHVGGEPERRPSLGRRSAVLLGGVFCVTYGVAIGLLAGEARGLHHVFIAVVDSLRNVPAYGFVFGIAFFLAHVTETYATTDERRDRGHALNAVLIAALACSMIYDTSFILFYPFYYNEPSIPVALLCLYMATERSGLVWATPFALAVSMLPTYGAKLSRALSADTIVTGGHWQGMRVNYRGVEILKAAARAQELAGASGTVLVLPEDVQLAGLIHRQRPPLKGAVIFVDQYPKRLLQQDLRALDAHLPDVIIIHPRRPRDWQSVFHTWSVDSAAEQLLNHVLTKVLPEHYVLDSTYPTIYFWDQGQLDVWVRKGEEEP
jgi:hypothetical protein